MTENRIEMVGECQNFIPPKLQGWIDHNIRSAHVKDNEKPPELISESLPLTVIKTQPSL
jgi:hypothetical protein